MFPFWFWRRALLSISPNPCQSIRRHGPLHKWKCSWKQAPNPSLSCDVSFLVLKKSTSFYLSQPLPVYQKTWTTAQVKVFLEAGPWSLSLLPSSWCDVATDIILQLIRFYWSLPKIIRRLNFIVKSSPLISLDDCLDLYRNIRYDTNPWYSKIML